MKISIAVGVVLALLAFDTAPASAAGRTLHVAPVGSDAAAGTEAAPFATVAHGLTALRPGDTLLLHGGTYVENITSGVLAAGTPDARITVAAAPGERPVLQGLLWLRRPSYWTIDGLRVTWQPGNPSTRHMVKVTGGVGWEVRNSEFFGAQSYAGLLVVGDPAVPAEPADWRVRGNCIHDTAPSNKTNQDHLIYVNTGTTAGAGTIERNLLFNAPNGSGVKLGGPSATDGGAANVTVRNNTVHATAQPVFAAWQSTHNTIEHNLLVGAGQRYAGIRGYQLSGIGNAAAHNVVGDATGVFLNDTGYGAVADGGTNVYPVDPRFDRVGSCDGYRPATAAAAAVGHLAGGETVSEPSPTTEVEEPTTTVSPPKGKKDRVKQREARKAKQRARARRAARAEMRRRARGDMR